MVIVKIKDIDKCCREDTGNSYDIIYITGKILVINPRLYRKDNVISNLLRYLKKRVREYRILFYAYYTIVNRERTLRGVQSEYISIDIINKWRILLDNARIILASGVYGLNSLDNYMRYGVHVLKPTVKALLSLKKNIRDVVFFDEVRPYYAIGIIVNEFGPLINAIYGDVDYISKILSSNNHLTNMEISKDEVGGNVNRETSV